MASTSRVPRLILLAAVVVLVASSCFGESAPEVEPVPEDESVPTTVVETTESDVAVDDQQAAEVPPVVGAFTWTEVLTMPDGFVQSFAVTDHGYYAVAGSHDDGFYPATRVWTSLDGTEWTELETQVFGSGASISALVAGGPGVIAAGFVPDGDTYSASVWTSGDGSSWQARPIGYTVPESDADSNVSIVNLDALAAGPDHGLVAGVENDSLDWSAAIEAVKSALPPGAADLPDDRIGMGPESVNVRVGPFMVFTSSLEDLGIDTAIADALAGMSGPPIEELVVFGSPDLEEWAALDTATLAASDVTFVSRLLWSGSAYVASVWGYGPGGVLVSDDGTTWEDAVLPSGAQELLGLYLQGDRLLGDAWAGEARILLTSNDGREWSELGALPGRTGTLGAGPLGIMVEGWGEDGAWCSPESMEPTVVENSEGTLTVSRSSLSVTSPSGEVVLEEQPRIADPMWGEELALPDGAGVDYEAETVTFVSDGVQLMTVTFDELESAYREACASSAGCCPFPTTHPGAALYFSQDGLEWTSQDLAETPIVGAVTDIFVGTAQVIVATIDESDDVVTSRLWLGTPSAEDAESVDVPASVDVPEAAMDGASPPGDVEFRLPPGMIPRTLATSPAGSVVIATSVEARSFGPSRAWASTDGGEWSELDSAVFGSGASVDYVAAGGPGLLAFGTLPGDEGAQAMVWSSIDGLTWTSVPLGVVLEPTDDPYTQSAIRYASVAATSDGAVVMADQSTGFAWQLLDTAVTAALPPGLRDTNRMIVDPDRVQVTWGPFVVFSERVEDLVVDQELFDAYNQGITGFDERRSVAFTTEDFVTWTATEVEETYWSLTPSRGGYLASTWAGGASCTMRQSVDGIDWSDAPCPTGALEVFQVTGGPDVLYATGATTSGNALWVSVDGGDSWETTGGIPANMYEVSAGDAGLVSVGEPGESGTEWVPPEMREPVAIEVDGYTMIIGPGDDGFAVLDEDGDVIVSETLSISYYHGEAYDLPESLALDTADQTLNVVDASGTEQFTITLEQLEDASCDIEGMCMGTPPDSVLWYSIDGSRWSETPFEDLVGYSAFAWNRLIAVSNDVLIAPMPTRDDEAVAIWRGAATP